MFLRAWEAKTANVLLSNHLHIHFLFQPLHLPYREGPGQAQSLQAKHHKIGSANNVTKSPLSLAILDPRNHRRREAGSNHQRLDTKKILQCLTTIHHDVDISLTMVNMDILDTMMETLLCLLREAEALIAKAILPTGILHILQPHHLDMVHITTMNTPLPSVTGTATLITNRDRTFHLDGTTALLSSLITLTTLTNLMMKRSLNIVYHLLLLKLLHIPTYNNHAWRRKQF